MRISRHSSHAMWWAQNGTTSHTHTCAYINIHIYILCIYIQHRDEDLKTQLARHSVGTEWHDVLRGAQVSKISETCKKRPISAKRDLHNRPIGDQFTH